MNEDAIIEEIRQIRSEYAKKFDYDIHAMVEDAKRHQHDDGRNMVDLPPRYVQLQGAIDNRDSRE